MKSTLKHLVRVGLVTAAVLVGMLTVQGLHAPMAHASGSYPQCYAGGGNGFASCTNMNPTSTYGPNSSTLCSSDAYRQGPRVGYPLDRKSVV